MRVLLILILMLLTAPAQAQAPAPADQSPDAQTSIEELVRILENEETRTELIQRLQQSVGTEEPAATGVDPELSLVRQLAQYTKAAAENTAATIKSLGGVFTDIQNGLRNTQEAEVRAFFDLAANLVLVAVALFGSFLVLRLLVLWVEKQIAARVSGRGWLWRLAGAFCAMLADAVSVLLAWGGGYLVALMFIGANTGRMEIGQSLLLNAFLLVELAKVVARLILSPRYEALRLIPVTDQNASYWSFWLSRIISLIGYTFLFVSPLVAANLDRGLAAAVQVVVMATAVTIGVVVVLQNKDDVRNWLTALAARRHNDGYGQVLLLIGRFWHILAIVYLIALLIAWFANPGEALPYMLSATVQSLVAVLVGTLVFKFVQRFVDGGLQLPGEIKERLPLLETRMQAFVPAVLQVVRWTIIAGGVFAVLQAWGLFDFVGWIGSDGGQALAGSIFSALLIVLIALGIHVAMSSWIEYRLNPNYGKPPTAREKTLLNLFKNAFTIALVVFGLMLALAQIGVNIAPLLAGAGVIGLAIGFGAQKLVQDIITGIFIQFENVMNEGDVVEAAGKAGVVEKLTIRSVTIRDMSGTVHLIPFSSVDQVSNMVRGFSFYVAEFEVSRQSDIEEVKQAMRDAFARVMESEHKDVILDDLDLQGLIAITPQSMSLRARIKTLAGQQWGAGRLYSELVLRLFDERGIETPMQRVSYVASRSGGQIEGPPMDTAPQGA